MFSCYPIWGGMTSAGAHPDIARPACSLGDPLNGCNSQWLILDLMPFTSVVDQEADAVLHSGQRGPSRSKMPPSSSPSRSQ